MFEGRRPFGVGVPQAGAAELLCAPDKDTHTYTRVLFLLCWFETIRSRGSSLEALQRIDMTVQTSLTLDEGSNDLKMLCYARWGRRMTILSSKGEIVSAASFVLSTHCRRLNLSLEKCVRMKVQNVYSLQNFPYETVLMH
jgi:hypothetical protein